MDKVTLDDCIQRIIENGKATGKSPVLVRDEIVKMIDSVIGSLEADDGVWQIPESAETAP